MIYGLINFDNICIAYLLYAMGEYFSAYRDIGNIR